MGSRHFSAFCSLKDDKYWENPPKAGKEFDLRIAVSSSAGVSKGASCHIPDLLLNIPYQKFVLTDLREFNFIGKEEFGSVTCYRIRGSHPRGGIYEMWIGAGDFLLRKLQRTRISPNLTTEEIHRGIEVNGDIWEEVFDFDPRKP